MKHASHRLKTLPDSFHPIVHDINKMIIKKISKKYKIKMENLNIIKTGALAPAFPHNAPSLKDSAIF